MNRVFCENKCYILGIGLDWESFFLIIVIKHFQSTPLYQDLNEMMCPGHFLASLLPTLQQKKKQLTSPVYTRG